MSEDARGSGAVAALLGIALALMLVVGGAVFYLVTQRLRQTATAAEVQARVAEDRAVKAELVRQTQLALYADARAREDAAAQRPADEEIRTAVEAVLRTQQEAWNRGDVDAFVEHYWKNGDITFSSGGKTTRGWEEMVRGYRQRYPTPEAMGQLAFANLEVTPLGPDAALVLGEWRLERDEPLAGNFSVVFRKLDGRWVIVHDHTSRTPSEDP